MSKIKELCKENAKKLYGKKLPSFISERIEEECDIIIKSETEELYFELLRIKELAKAENAPIIFRNPAAASLSSFLGGIGYLNPLPAHYLCDCGYFEFPEVPPHIMESAPDLPDKICPKCKKPLKKDGYNIPVECCFPGGMDRSVVPMAESTEKFFKSVLSKEYEPLTRDEAVNSRLFPELTRAVKKDIEESEKMEMRILKIAGMNKERFDSFFFKKENNEDKKGLILIGQVNPHVEFLVNLEKATGVMAGDIEYGERKTFSLFTGNTATGNTRMLIPTAFGTLGVPVFEGKNGMRLLSEVRPVRFGQLIRITGAIMGDGTWDNNGLQAYREEGIKLEDIITTQDDIYRFLQRYAVPKERILILIRQVMDNRSVTEDALRELSHYGVPDSFMYSISQIKYLFSRNFAIYHNSLAWHSAWYKAYFPEDFYREYINTYGSSDVKENIRAGKNRVFQLLEEYDPETASDLGKGKCVEFPIYHLALEMYERGFSYNG